MSFTITETQVAHPEDIHTRLKEALGSATVSFYPKAADKLKLVENIQEIITGESTISIELEDVESLLKDAQSIHVVDWADDSKNLTQLTTEAVDLLKPQLNQNASFDLLLILQSEEDLEIRTFSDCIDIVQPLGQEDTTLITGDMNTGRPNRVFLLMACH